MLFLIEQLGFWLLATALLAALSGWALAALRAEPAGQARRRDRDKLIANLAQLASEGEAPPLGLLESERELEALRRRAELDKGRISELERALESARGRADDAASRIALLERESGVMDQDERDELLRLRGLVSEYEAEQARTFDVEIEPVEDTNEEGALQAWRLRYFEQRVRYLEGLDRTETAPAPAPVVIESSVPEWRAREADARAAYLADELRRLEAAPEVEDESAFAADPDVDMLLRWRMLYLERRVSYLQQELGEAPELMPEAEPEFDTEQAERWKWRSRYLEARVRHFEQRARDAQMESQRLAARTIERDPEPVYTPPSATPKRPNTLPAARNGAPDDLSLIAGVSVLQQSTLNSLGVFHFDQIAAWTPENVAWVDRHLRLRGRIEHQQWVEQADALARRGAAVGWRMREREDA